MDILGSLNFGDYPVYPVSSINRLRIETLTYEFLKKIKKKIMEYISKWGEFAMNNEPFEDKN